ncbi:hypothetical protein GCM10009784_15150 [Arthrobacter parietis]|uniref:SH3 domain-containing protein n=2 Tax=Arthrobacter TaxID=1663 RepID=A0ABT6CZ72_9MICC|nr:hypothetical protein [Arthrobacter vasquezii]MDF9279338.1 hypothetical protein [Arthrobacter vasquezii]
MNTRTDFDPARLQAMRHMLVEHAGGSDAGAANSELKSISTRGKVLLAGTIMTGSLAVGGGALAISGTGWFDIPCEEAVDGQCYPVLPQTPDWPENEFGQTYGMQVGEEYPDLVRVIATNGKMGYIYAEELQPVELSSPEDVAAWKESVAGTVEVATVYQNDGKTVIGEFITGDWRNL